MEYRMTRQCAVNSLKRAEQLGLPDWAVKYCYDLIAKADRHHAQSRVKGIAASLRDRAVAGRAEDILAVTGLFGGYYRHQPIEDVFAAGIQFNISEQRKHMVADDQLLSGSNGDEHHANVAELHRQGYGRNAIQETKQ